MFYLSLDKHIKYTNVIRIAYINIDYNIEGLELNDNPCKVDMFNQFILNEDKNDLRTVMVDGTYGELIQQIFIRPHCLSITSENIRDIEIILRDDKGCFP